MPILGSNLPLYQSFSGLHVVLWCAVPCHGTHDAWQAVHCPICAPVPVNAVYCQYCSVVCAHPVFRTQLEACPHTRPHTLCLNTAPLLPEPGSLPRWDSFTRMTTTSRVVSASMHLMAWCCYLVTLSPCRCGSQQTRTCMCGVANQEHTLWVTELAHGMSSTTAD